MTGHVEQPPVRIWRWLDAPEEYRALSEHGGDEDWVALVPAHLAADALNGRPPLPLVLAANSVDWYPQGDGGVVGIGAHA